MTMQRNKLVQELVAGLNEMEITELLKFKEDEIKTLESLGYSEGVCAYCSRIIEVVIQVKRERVGEAV